MESGLFISIGTGQVERYHQEECSQQGNTERSEVEWTEDGRHAKKRGSEKTCQVGADHCQQQVEVKIGTVVYKICDQPADNRSANEVINRVHCSSFEETRIGCGLGNNGLSIASPLHYARICKVVVIIRYFLAGLPFISL